MKMILVALPLLAAGIAVPAQAAVYRCVNAQGEKILSDKPCPPSHTTQKIYTRPQAPAPEAVQEEESALPSAGNPLLPQSEDEMRAMLRARERRIMGLPPEDSAEERAWLAEQERQLQERKRGETKRQMESYLQQKDQQRSEWRSERQDGAGYEQDVARDSRRQRDCARLQQQKNGHTAAARSAYSSGSAASARSYHLEAEREAARRMSEQGCN